MPESIKKQLEGKAELTEAQKKELKKESELARKRGKLRYVDKICISSEHETKV